MPNPKSAEPVRRAQRAWGNSSRELLVTAILAVAQFLLLGAAAAHEGHDHDNPAPLNLPIAPRVVTGAEGPAPEEVERIRMKNAPEASICKTWVPNLHNNAVDGRDSNKKDREKSLATPEG